MRGVTGRVIVGLLWLVILIAAAGAWSAGARSADTIRLPAPGGFEPVLDRRPADLRSDSEPAVPLVDLYGNEIERAVTGR